jgi:hypothetical protein
VMLIFPVPCLFVLFRVDRQVTEDPEAQQVENTLFTTELLGSTYCCFMWLWVLRYTLFMIVLLLQMCYLPFMTRSLG